MNGASNNGAASAFATSPAFGNNRAGLKSLYNGSLGFTLDNSTLDARSYSITGQDTPKPGTNNFRGLLSFGGPLKIPRLLPNGGPNFVINYQWLRNRNATTNPGLVPTALQRAGDFSQFALPVLDPLNGARISGEHYSAEPDQSAGEGAAESLSAAEFYV